MGVLGGLTPESLCAGISRNEEAQRFEYRGTWQYFLK
jgi:hypothetical protein